MESQIKGKIDNSAEKKQAKLPLPVGLSADLSQSATAQENQQSGSEGACSVEEKIPFHKAIVSAISNGIRNFSLKNSIKTFWYLFSFVALIFVYFSTTVISNFYQIRFIPFFFRNLICSPSLPVLNKLSRLFDPDRNNSISRIHLIELALKSMTVKKTRSFITIGGMAVGIAIIVFLVSLGYGLQEVVIGKVARLDEMKQIDIRAQAGSRVIIDDKSLATLNDVSGIDKIMPLIAVVGKVSFNNSSSDVAVYGVTADYLNASAIQPSNGKIFQSNETSMKLPIEPLLEQSKNAIQLQQSQTSDIENSQSASDAADLVDENNSSDSARLDNEKNTSDSSPEARLQEAKPAVAGVTTSRVVSVGEKAGKVTYRLNPNEWVRVRTEPGTLAEIVGYTRRDSEEQSGLFYYGEFYPTKEIYGDYAQISSTKKSGLWIKSSVQIWKKETCRELVDPDCEESEYKLIRDENGDQKFVEGYFAVLSTTIISSDLFDANNKNADVLGEFIAQAELPDTPSSSSESAEVVTSSDSEFIDVASESAAITSNRTFMRKIPDGAVKEVVINRSFAKILGLTENNAVGKSISTSFILTSDLLDEADKKVESVATDYKIIGVIPDDGSPIMYVPFVDLRALGVTKVSQVKVSIFDQKNMDTIRKSIESFGFSTSSVSDTVEQINSLFGVMRTVLGILGLVALFVASLGMFNTLTVSLLERTHEVGLMKAMGMKSNEVQELFLTESIIMGIMGGLFGVVIGFVVGQAFSAFLSIFSVSRGFGYLQISVIPLELIVVVLSLSFVVGISTGIYPAQRAKKISALNALRYE